MSVELVNTGSELMLGRVLNTHQSWLCRSLADDGFVVTRQVAVSDAGAAIRDAIAEALGRARLVITTGGLGPTADDLTRDMVAALLQRRLVEDASARANIEAFFVARQRAVPERVLVQALVPEGALVLPNRNGTAPGLAVEVPSGPLSAGGALLVLLPGPPRELRPMYDHQVRPLLRARLPVSEFHCRTLRTTGIGESSVEETLSTILPPFVVRGLEVGYCARPGEVDVRLSAHGASGRQLVEDSRAKVRDCLDPWRYGEEDELLEEVVVRELKRRGGRLAVAESCTGGLLAHRITNVAGASEVFWGGWVTYDNAAKTGQLGVRAEILQDEGAVSGACVKAMADGALDRSAADHALAITGIAGPTGGTLEKPVGTVYIALASKGAPTEVQLQRNPYDRETFKHVTTQQALEMLRRSMISSDDRRNTG